MTTLKIGTVLIAKKDAFMNGINIQHLTKGKEYIIKDITSHEIIFESDFDKNHYWFISEVENNFTIKRYTLTDLKDKKIAVKLRSKEEYIKMCKLCGDDDLSGYSEENDYCGFDVKGQFAYLYIDELENRTLLESIDEIDLEEKEEEHKPINKVAELIGEASMCWSETPKGIFDSTRASKIVDEIEAVYNSEIIRIKEENKELKVKAEKFIKTIAELSRLNAMREPSESEKSERTRMAWELMVRSIQVENGKHYSLAAEYCLNEVDSFLAKSKEVGNG